MLFPPSQTRAKGRKRPRGKYFFYRVFARGSCYPPCESEGQYFLGLL